MPLFTKSFRRGLGIVFLGLACVLFVLGVMLSESKATLLLGGMCWVGSFLSTCMAMVMAVLDLRAIRKHWKEEHHNLVKTSFSGIDLAGKKPADDPSKKKLKD